MLATLLLLCPAPLQDIPSDEDLLAIQTRAVEAVGWETEWAPAAARAEAEGKLVLVLFTQFPPPSIVDELALGPYLQPDVTELIAARYVPLRWSPTKEAPFRNPDVYGVGPFAFGTSTLVARPDGSIVGETFSFESTTLFERLAELGATDRVEPLPGGPGLAAARVAAQVGVDGPALRLTPEAGWTPEDARFAMRVALRHRDAGRALRIGEAMRRTGIEPNEVARLEAVALLRTEREEEAVALLARVPADHVESPEARLLEIEVHLHHGREAEVVALATGLVTDHPQTRAAAVAAGLLRRREHLAAFAGKSFAWPDRALVELAAAHGPSTRPERQPLERELEQCVLALVATQRPDGSWANGFELMGVSDPLRFPLTVATTALAARALVPHHADPRCEPALRRALAFLREARRITEAEGDALTGFDYTTWTKASFLLLMREAVRHGAVELDDWRATLTNVVAELEAKQKPSGGWIYYPTPQDVSLTFVNAYVVLGLDAARELELEVSPQLVERALASVERARIRDVVFDYVSPGEGQASDRGQESSTAGRAPLCALALHRFEHADLDEVRQALDLFLRHRAIYARESGKVVMHGGPGGEGSHYLLFDYLYAAEALLALPADERAPYRAAVLDQLETARAGADRYIDNPITTDRYATAMAAWILHLLTE